jgi:Asp-tRNA(Asn)/Glu-tRNA(Gln) amidotransferase A subunit family amidase
MREMDTLMARYDVLLSPTGSATLGVTNLTGHPALALKAGFVDNAPVELMLTGRLYDEATLLRTALAFERGTDWHTRNPTM